MIADEREFFRNDYQLVKVERMIELGGKNHYFASSPNDNLGNNHQWTKPLNENLLGN